MILTLHIQIIDYKDTTRKLGFHFSILQCVFILNVIKAYFLNYAIVSLWMTQLYIMFLDQP